MTSPLPLPVGLVPMGGGEERRWVVGECYMQKEGGGRAGGVDVEEVQSPDIKCCQYLSSISKCAHVLIDPVFSTPGMMSWRL